MPGTNPTVEIVSLRADSPRSVVHAFDRLPHRTFVGQRLTHSHEHDVAEATLHRPCLAGRGGDLLDDLADGQVAREAGLARRAEAASHRTADLAADAHRDAIGVQHQHGFDAFAVVKLPQVLDGVAAIADAAHDDLQRRHEPLGQRRPQRLGKVGHL